MKIFINKCGVPRNFVYLYKTYIPMSSTKVPSMKIWQLFLGRRKGSKLAGNFSRGYCVVIIFLFSFIPDIDFSNFEMGTKVQMVSIHLNDRNKSRTLQSLNVTLYNSWQKWIALKKEVTACTVTSFIYVVGGTGFEPVTSTVWR